MAGFEQLERDRFLSEHLDRRLRGTANPRLRQWIRDAAVLDLPDAPTEAQVEAWLELAEMVSDPTFLERHRQRSALAPSSDRSQERWPTRVMPLFEPAARAARAGIDPVSRKAQPIVERWVRAFARENGRRDLQAFADEMLRPIDAHHDDREQRFWQLVGVLKPEVACSPVSVGLPWLISALRAWMRCRSEGRFENR